MKHTISLLVENEPGVLSRVTGLISRRGFNIESLVVGVTDNKSISRMTIVVDADEHSFEQIIKQLNKLVSVSKISDLTHTDAIERELRLFKVAVSPEKRGEVIQIVNVFRAKVVDVSLNSLTIEVTGDEKKLRGIQELLEVYGITEMLSTGKIAMARSPKDN